MTVRKERKKREMRRVVIKKTQIGGNETIYSLSHTHDEYSDVRV